MSTPYCATDMTTCPECVRHVRHCEGASTVECPFCETSFAPGQAGGQAPSGSAIPRGLKTGAMAVAFAGATALAGCTEPPDDSSGFNVQENDAGQNADTGEEYDVPPAEPVYGAPPPDGGYNQDDPDADAGDTDAGQDTEDEDAGD